MKKIAALALTLVIVLAVSGCNLVKFSTPTAYEKVNETSEVTISIQDQSLTDTGLTLLIQSNVEEELSYGTDYTIEQNKDGSWYSMDGEQVFNSLAAILKPGDTNEFDVTWEKKLPKGAYRVVKPVNTSQGATPLAAEFEVR
nr:immunoglobulin-like domain-containing protein [uncultured Solibaculum sp.]